MRVLFTAVAGRPHLYPLVPLAWACRTAGHEVRFASSRSGTEAIIEAGLPAVLVGTGPRLTSAERADLVGDVYSQPAWPADWAIAVRRLDDRQRALLARLGRYLVSAAEAMVDDLITFARQWRPDILVHDAITYAGPVAAELLGIPAVRHNFGSASLPRLELGDDGPLPEYVRLFGRFGLAPVLDATAVVEPTPPSLRFPVEVQPCHDVRYIPYNGPGLSPPWLEPRRQRPRICLTWGHTSPDSAGDAAAGPYRIALDALAATDVDLIVVSTAEQLSLLGEVPPNVRTAASVPLHFVVEHCDAIVQQGGDGTTLTAAAAGLPQLVITNKPDSEIAAGRLVSAGSGIHLHHQRLRETPGAAETIRLAMDRLLHDPPFRDAATRLRAEIERQPPPSEVVGALTRLPWSDRTPARLATGS